MRRRPWLWFFVLLVCCFRLGGGFDAWYQAEWPWNGAGQFNSCPLTRRRRCHTGGGRGHGCHRGIDRNGCFTTSQLTGGNCGCLVEFVLEHAVLLDVVVLSYVVITNLVHVIYILC